MPRGHVVSRHLLQHVSDRGGRARDNQHDVQAQLRAAAREGRRGHRSSATALYRRGASRGQSSGAVNEWLAAAANAVAVCSELCALLSLRDFASKEPRVVNDGEVIDFGSHRLRFLMTPQVNQWNSLRSISGTA